MNNTPNIGPYTELKPFRFWCQKVLPLVYDESLSYYELLCKVVDYLNKTMEDVDQMIIDMGDFQTAYTEFIADVDARYLAFTTAISEEMLQFKSDVNTAIMNLETFVNNYFDNLDVQDEIDHKIDEMAEDGYFDELFARVFGDNVIGTAQTYVTAWISANLSQQAGFVVDKSLTVDEAAADAKATGDEINNLKIGLSPRTITAEDLPFTFGGIAAATGVANDDTNRRRSTVKLPETIDLILPQNEYGVAIFGYSNGTYSGWWDGSAWVTTSIVWNYDHIDITEAMRDKDIFVVYRDSASDTLTADDDAYIFFYNTFSVIVKDMKTRFANKLFRNGTLGNPGNANGISMEDIIPYDASSYTIIINKALQDPTDHFIVTYATYSVSSGKTGTNAANRMDFDIQNVFATDQKVITINKDPNFLGSVGIAFGLIERTSENVAVPLRVSDFDPTDFIVIKNYEKRSGDFVNYEIGPDFTKKELFLKYIGSLSNFQSFLIYNGYYYSTSGTAITKQSADFTVVDSVTVDVGHGNSFCLGHENYGYISGWDDDKVYKIDLDDLSVDATISLPVSGYTTCAVDDLNGIMYIFQRTSQPNTEEQYNFIVYDYVNDSVISTKKTSVEFGAMQSCFFFRDKIFVVNGTGTATLPNGYRVYNTNGEIIGEYVIGSFSEIEPEGVALDLATMNLYISYGNSKVYLVETE